MFKVQKIKSLLLVILFASSAQIQAFGWDDFNRVMTNISNVVSGIAIAVTTAYIIKKYVEPAVEAEQKVKPETFISSVPTTKLSDIVGSQPEELETFWDMHKNPDKYLKKGLKPAKSMLFHGEPGTGKTEYARAIAHELNARFFELPSAAFQSEFYGKTGQKIKELFNKARISVAVQKLLSGKKYLNNEVLVVIFIDEIDGLGKSRSLDNGLSCGESQAALTILLSELTKHAENEHILIIGATNLKDKLDPALIRPGRFDLCIEFALPNKNDRAQILEHYGNKLSLNIKPQGKKNQNDPDFYQALALKTEGFNNAELRELCNKVALISVKKDIEHVSMQNFEDAIKLMRPAKEKLSPEKAMHVLKQLISQNAQKNHKKPNRLGNNGLVIGSAAKAA